MLGERERSLLACDIASRPEAPGIDAVLAFVREVVRDGDAVAVDFDHRGAETVRAFVAAERACCAQLGWFLDDSSGLRLTVTGTSGQVDLIGTMLGRPEAAGQ
jgi:hypothetical protein